MGKERVNGFICAAECFSKMRFFHGHAHNDEPPHLKYTREVNEAAKLEDEVEHVHHKQAHSHGHHSHDDEHAGHGSKRMANTHPKISTAAYNDQPYDKDSYLSFLNDPQTRLWTYAVGSTLLISAFPCFLLAFIPIRENTGDDSPLLRTLLAFGAGGLLGDAFLHLIPHATPSGHSHSHSHTGGGGHSHEPHDLSVGLWVLVGFMTFFIVEKFVRIVRGNDSPGHGHSHHHQKEEKAKKKLSDDEDEAEKLVRGKPKKKKVGEERDEEKSVKQPGRIRVAAYLNLVADFMHNFTDGLAIGASFVAGSTVGLVTMVTVLVHEVPHEIGDFAILVQSGFSKPRAMLIQLCTALGALAGCVLSLWDVDAAALAEAAEQSWAIPFTAGGFIYIGSVSMIPDLLEQSTAWQSVKEVCALLLGLAMMLVETKQFL
uniref:Zinc transporter n=1 Tax=Globodera rostochiensis TaxID=31243 RepID=A0A914H1R9_GLORO